MNQTYVSAKEVAEYLAIGKSTAYAIIKEWNGELEERGYFTKAGHIPKAYFETKCYGYQDN